jgi:hypothetical protein
MAVTLNASTSSGLVQTADTSGVLTLQSNGTAALSVSSSNLQFNSGYGSVATAYGCRAWINFNGTGTPAIRGSGNVTSITDNGTGDYTINFTTAMPDANFATLATSVNTSFSVTVSQTTTTTQIRTTTVTPALVDASIVNIAVFR